MEILGVSESRHLGFEDGQTAQHMSDLVRALDEVMAELRPDEVYLPYPSLHQDHIAVYEAGMRSSRVSMSSAHWFPPSVFVYDIAVYDVNLYPSDLRWNVFESLDQGHIDRKTAACQAYRVRDPHRGAPDQQRASDRRRRGSRPVAGVRRAVRPGPPGPPVRVAIHQPTCCPGRASGSR